MHSWCIHLVNTQKVNTHLCTHREQWFLWNKARKTQRESGYRKMPVSTHAHAITHPHRRTYTHSLCVSHTHKQERNSNYLEMSPDIACHSQRPWSGFAHRTSYSAHTQTHTRSGRERGGKKAEGHVGGKRGTRQHLQSPLLIALLPAWSQITHDAVCDLTAVWALPLGQPPPSSDPYFQTS